MKQAPKIGVCGGMFHPMSVGDLISLAGRHGYTSLMFLPTQWLRPDAPSAAETRRMLDANGIVLTSLDGVMTGLPRLPPEAQQFVLAEDEYFRIADEVGATCFNVPHYRGDPKTSVAAFVDALGPLCERAAKHGISIALEFLPGTGIPDLAAANRISEAVNLPNIGVTIDTWHLARSKGTLADVQALPPGRIKAFQISDRTADADPDEEMWGRLIPGTGVLPLKATLDAVLANNPNIGVDAEIFSKDLLTLSDDDSAAKVARALRVLMN